MAAKIFPFVFRLACHGSAPSSLGRALAWYATTMFIFLLASAATSLSARGGPQSTNGVSALDTIGLAFPRADELDCECPNTRSLLDIIWSCVATILLCTWVSMHPNMPPPGENPIKTILRRAKMMISTLVAPEMMLMFAMRQWLAARQEARKYRKHKWTMTHGHFLIMGGFVLMKGKEDLGTLSYELLEKLHEDGDIEFPSVTKEELEDRSKGDPLSKAMAILQSLWFIIQVIARAAQGLAITELEIVTLAFCSLTGVMYFFWWSKPLDAECRIPVYIKPGSDYFPKFDLKRAEKITDVDRALKDIVDALQAETESNEGSQLEDRFSFRAKLKRLRRALRVQRQDIQRRWKKMVAKFDAVAIILSVLFIILSAALIVIILVIFAMAHFLFIMTELLGTDESETIPPGQNRVSTFYSPPISVTNDGRSLTLYGVTGTIFGAIHCIAWRFHFPTHAESLIWRSMSLTITFIPILMPLYINTITPLDFYIARGKPEQGFGARMLYTLCVALDTFGLWFVIMTLFFYVPARCILVVQSFVLLRDLSLSALLDVDWQNFVPHF